MTNLELLQNAGLETIIRETGTNITTKCTKYHEKFDSWYTNRDFVLRELAEDGQIVAKEIRIQKGFSWSK